MRLVLQRCGISCVVTWHEGMQVGEGTTTVNPRVLSQQRAGKTNKRIEYHLHILPARWEPGGGERGGRGGRADEEEEEEDVGPKWRPSAISTVRGPVG
jgi:hypothetical protein